MPISETEHTIPGFIEPNPTPGGRPAIDASNPHPEPASAAMPVHGESSPSYRIEWWNPVPGGEWVGRWDVFDEASMARTLALALLASDEDPGIVLLVALGEGGRETARAVVGQDELETWLPAIDAMPHTARDPYSLPPLGRDDVETQTLGTCRDALLVAVNAGLMGEEHVAPLIETIQRAFSGVDPALGDDAR